MVMSFDFEEKRISNLNQAGDTRISSLHFFLLSAKKNANVFFPLILIFFGGGGWDILRLLSHI